MGIRQRRGVENANMHWAPSSWPLLSIVSYYRGRKTYGHVLAPLNTTKALMVVDGYRRIIVRLLKEKLVDFSGYQQPDCLLIETDGAEKVGKISFKLICLCKGILVRNLMASIAADDGRNQTGDWLGSQKSGLM